jgi:hypothetical protein
MLRFCAQPGHPPYRAGAEAAMAMANANGWAVASIKNGWRTVFA